jgi:predicted enzyme related to lactoylglutathione lyase
VGGLVSFHLPVDDMDRAVRFYREAFGWDLRPFPGSPVPYVVGEAAARGAGGIPAALVSRDHIIRAPVPTIEVEDIDRSMTRLAMRGGRQGSVRDIPGVGRFGFALDSEGNTIALVQRPAPEASPPSPA